MITDEERSLWVGTSGGGVNVHNADSEDFLLVVNEEGKIDGLEIFGEEEKDISEKSIDEDMHNMIAKVDSRSKSKAGEKIDIAIDLDHCHIFDKETEITILARDEENKAEIEALQAKRAQEQAEKAAVNAAKKAENEAKLAAEAEKQRAKMEKKLAKKAVKQDDAKEEVVEEVEPNAVVEKVVIEEKADDQQ